LFVCFFNSCFLKKKIKRKKKLQSKRNKLKTKGAKRVASMNTYSNRRVANHLHGLIFELKERMNSRQDRPVIQKRNLVRMREKKKKKRKTYFSFFLFFFSFSFQFCLNCKVVDTPFVEFKYLAR